MNEIVNYNNQVDDNDEYTLSIVTTNPVFDINDTKVKGSMLFGELGFISVTQENRHGRPIGIFVNAYTGNTNQHQYNPYMQNNIPNKFKAYYNSNLNVIGLIQIEREDHSPFNSLDGILSNKTEVPVNAINIGQLVSYLKTINNQVGNMRRF